MSASSIAVEKKGVVLVEYKWMDTSHKKQSLQKVFIVNTKVGVVKSCSSIIKNTAVRKKYC